MKKQYQTPFVTIQEISPIELICSSITSISGVGELDISDEGTDEAGITYGNSRKSIWDDDEEYEY
jgi:hypothetical protein